ncbi:uncharacterized protein LOC123674262 isoform X2 [Harmonia axyridis]|uniref:uncharacterized protein LOC123674262 isoform X2 n=1 Tax=Harmonia axyridis TaxID=115357 RepID=UPI001E279CC9|nr:uncharacterized protein LOC123674262 isoform X2 [Harmonia axyridis]
MNDELSVDFISLKKPAFPGSLTDLHRFRKTVHGHNGSSRIVMVRKTDQRTFASLKNGQDPKIETITRETIETFRGPRTACKVTTEKKDCEEEVPPDIFESLIMKSRSCSRLDSKPTPTKSRYSLMDTFAKECLQAHNEFRKKHGVPPLKLSKEICRDSQKWADHLIKAGGLAHSNNDKYGENIFCMQSSNPSFTVKGNEPVESWYKEMDKHPFGEEPKNLESGHFSQVVWRDSKELGVGYAKSGGKVIVVANYYPPGNYVGRYVENVPPLGSTPSEVRELARDIHKISIRGADDSLNVGTFEGDFLDAHNKYRALHGVGPLELDRKLSKYAEEWARHLAFKNVLETRPNCNYGENIYKVSSTDASFTLEGNVPVEKWYLEGKKHIYDKEPNDLSTGHFTQLIWKSSKQLGVGIAKHQGSIIVVANYSPAGNFVKQFVENVPPPLRSGSVSPTKSEKNNNSHHNDRNNVEFSQFALEGLKVHNEYRRKHGVPEMKLNKEMCDYSQEWADICAKSGRMSHRPNSPYGENIFYSYSSDTSATPTARDAVKAWYDEIKLHTFGVETMNTGTLHFTQVVWKESTELGIALSKNRKGETYVVANYNPRGNFMGQFVQNVPRPRQ